jgi:hypothetical protein
MKKIIALWMTVCSMTLPMFSQNSEQRQLPPFTKVSIESIAKIYLRQDSVQSVLITSDAPLQSVETRVSNNTLYIEGGESELVISMPVIEKLAIRGNGQIIGQEPLQADQLVLDISGNGKMTLDVSVKELKTIISGLGKITLNGSAVNTDVSISGSGKLDAIGLKTNTCHADISGVGKCAIDVTDTLNSEISGSGKVEYKTAPKQVTNNISGIGKTSSYSGSESKADTTKMTIGGSEVLIIGKHTYSNGKWKARQRPTWQGFEMGINSYVTPDGSFDVPEGYSFLELHQEKSVSVGLNLLQKNYQLGHSNVWFFTGLGVTWNNYHFADNVTLYNTTPITASIDTASKVRHIKSKLTDSYLMVPLMFEAFTSRNPKNALHFGAGALLGLRLGSHTKQKAELDNDVFKTKVYDDFGLNTFRAGVRAAIGFHRLNLFADYYFTPLFKSGSGPKLYPVNFGITLLGI